MERHLVNKHSPTGKRRRAAIRAQTIAPSYESPDQFALRVGASRSTIWRMMRDGRLRWMRIGTRLRRIPISEHERLASESNRQPPGYRAVGDLADPPSLPTGRRPATSGLPTKERGE